MKKHLLILLTICILLLSITAYGQTPVRVYVNNMRVNEDVILKDGRTYVPLRAVSEAMGAEVMWNQDTFSAHISFSEDDAVSKIVENVSPSVVTLIGNYSYSQTIDQYNNPTVHGSGVIYKTNGYIITNAHVVEDIKNLTVVFSDGTLLPGKVLFSDEKADLAIVKADKLGLKPISFADASGVVSGRTAIALGTPISLSMRNTVTKGIISGTDVSMDDSYYKLLQTDASINPGNSGGPLVNIKGELIGINSSKYMSVGIDNIAFAIPVDTVQYVISQYESHGKILRPNQDFVLDQSWEAKMGIPTKKGITVKSSSNSQLKPGDVILFVNGIEVHSITDWNEAIKDTYNGRALTVEYKSADGAVRQVELAI